MCGRGAATGEPVVPQTVRAVGREAFSLGCVFKPRLLEYVLCSCWWRGAVESVGKEAVHEEGEDVCLVQSAEETFDATLGLLRGPLELLG